MKFLRYVNCSGFTDDGQYVSFLACIRDRVNIGLFIYAMSVATAHREGDHRIKLPSLVQIAPNHFIEGGVLNQARIMVSNNEVRNINEVKIIGIDPEYLTPISF
jgi:hypothetical protein